MTADRPLDRAVRALRKGRVVAYPTDTVIGLGVLAGRPAAVERLRALKGRPEGPPFSVMLSSVEEVEAWAELSPSDRAMLRRLLPGPYTLLLPASRRARARWPVGIVGKDGRIGVRIPDHPIARALARIAGAVTSTSANPHGEPPARSIGEARRRFGRAVAIYLSGAPDPSGRPSTLVDLSQARARFLGRR